MSGISRLLLIVYIVISIKYGSSNTALQSDHFEGESLMDTQNPKLQWDEESNLQGRFNSNPKSYSKSANFFPKISKGNNFIYSKAPRSFHVKDNFKKNKIISRIKKRKSKHARRHSKTSNRAALDDTENIKNLFNKSGLPLEYAKKTFQISVDSKEDSPELFRTKDLEKWRKKKWSQRRRVKNKGNKGSSNRNFFKDWSKLFKNKNGSKRKSKKRSIGLQSKKSALPMETRFFHHNYKCQPLKSLHLFEDVKVGKFDPDLYKECPLLQKTSKVELLIKNEGDVTKYLKDALHGDVFSVFKLMTRVTVTPVYESEIVGEHINLSDNIQTPSKSWENSDLINIDAEEDKFLPIDPNESPVFKSLPKEIKPSNEDKNIAGMYLFPNNIVNKNNFSHKGDGMGNKINGNNLTDEIPQRQGLNEKVPSINPPIVTEHQNYVQIENKETLSKIILPINDTAAKELFEANIKRLKPTTVPQVEYKFTNNQSKYMETPEEQNLGTGINMVPILETSNYARTEFPNIPIEEWQFLKPITSSYSPSRVTSTKTESHELENNIKQTDYQFFTEKTLNILPSEVYSSSVKLKPIESTTNATETKQPISESATLPTFAANAKDIHIVITEPFITEMIPGTTVSNILWGNTETDYSANNPPVDLIPKEEIQETDPKLLKMHIKHLHGTKEPEIRHRRQFFRHQ